MKRHQGFIIPPPHSFLTGNSGKRREIQAVVKDATFIDIHVDLPEIQPEDHSLESLIAVSHYKAREAFHRLGFSVIVEDTSLSIHALDGYPGGLVKLLSSSRQLRSSLCASLPRDTKRTAVARCILAWSDGTTCEHVIGETNGTIALMLDSAEHDVVFGWDDLFIPSITHHSFFRMGHEAKIAVSMRGEALRQLG